MAQSSSSSHHHHHHHANRPQIAILDFGSQYSHLIARRLRELHIFCELYSCAASCEELFGGGDHQDDNDDNNTNTDHSSSTTGTTSSSSTSSKKQIIGIVLSGGPNSVYDPTAPHVRPEVWNKVKEWKIPVLGICYGMQELAHVFGGRVAPCEKREYGKAVVTQIVEGASSSSSTTTTDTAAASSSSSSPLLEGLPHQFDVWMSHGDKLHEVPAGFRAVAGTPNASYVAIENLPLRMWGIQFHPEVTHTPRGIDVLRNFAVHIVGAAQDWIVSDYANEFVRDVRSTVGPRGHVLGAVSGGVDSTVAAVLMTRAIGNRFHAILVDNGCLRKNEAAQVLTRMRDDCGVNLRCVCAQDLFLKQLKGVTDPEEKRKIIGGTFIDIFQEESRRLEEEHDIKCEFLLQGTLYPDVIESVSYKGPSATIKTHHNVGGLPASMKLKLIEPLRELFKDEVRELGLALGIDEASVWRHPFPGPGLAIRIIGEVTPERVAVLQEADAIVIEELVKSGHYRSIGQAFVVLLPDVKSVGVMGDGRTYENVACVRCVETTDYMTADFYHLPHDVLGRMSSRVINEVVGINRLCYDISSKPPATIEWE